jgi:hypothetical protein
MTIFLKVQHRPFFKAHHYYDSMLFELPNDPLSPFFHSIRFIKKLEPIKQAAFIFLTPFKPNLF